MQHPLAIFRFCPVCGSEAFAVHDARSKRCAHCGFTYYHNAAASTVALIENKRGELLVVRRALPPAQGTLDLPGGFVDPGETLADGCRREVREETGLTLTRWRFRGLVTFVSDVWPCEYMHLFTADAWTGEQKPCDEGELAWIGKDELLTKKLWEGDRIFLRLLADDAPFFSLKLVYRGEELTAAELDGKELLLDKTLPGKGSCPQS